MKLNEQQSDLGAGWYCYPGELTLAFNSNASNLSCAYMEHPQNNYTGEFIGGLTNYSSEEECMNLTICGCEGQQENMVCQGDPCQFTYWVNSNQEFWCMTDQYNGSSDNAFCYPFATCCQNLGIKIQCPLDNVGPEPPEPESSGYNCRPGYMGDPDVSKCVPCTPFGPCEFESLGACQNSGCEATDTHHDGECPEGLIDTMHPLWSECEKCWLNGTETINTGEDCKCCRPMDIIHPTVQKPRRPGALKESVRARLQKLAGIKK